MENADTKEETKEVKEDPIVDDDEESVYEEVDDELYDDDNVVDLRAYRTMGGGIYIDLIQLPPQRKKIKYWVIREGLRL